VEGAEATAALFTKDGDQVNNLYDMQCTWYEIESGRAWLRRSQYGKVIMAVAFNEQQCVCMERTAVLLLQRESNDVNYANQSLYGEMRPTFPLIA
jgi:NMDA receptor-regulated protein 1